MQAGNHFCLCILPHLKMQAPQRKCLSAVSLVDLADLKWNIPVIRNRQISPKIFKRRRNKYLWFI